MTEILEEPMARAVVPVLCDDEGMACSPHPNHRRATILDTLAGRSRSSVGGVLRSLQDDSFPSHELANK